MGRRTIVFGVVILLLLGSVVMAFHQTGGQVVSNPLEVMTYNIGDLNGHQPLLKDVAEIIKSHGIPDILLVQEIAGKKAVSRLSRMLGLPHFTYSNYKGKKHGLAILSRIPITEPQTLYFKASNKGYGILSGGILIDGHNVTIYSVHLDRIDPIKIKAQKIDIGWETALRFLKTELLEETVRSKSVAELIAWLSESKSNNVIIGGDFNTVPFSKAIRKMNQAFDDALWPSWNYLTTSYQKFPLPIAPRIDYLFHSPDLKCSNAAIIKAGPGDHYPVKAAFSILST
ncbi:MAG: endonuclease/exonuclease/phosphatase family protein [Candidatus Desulfatibia sp.]|uniref:endonuclease/exonuclease/phosphatase family protein n=1 Tax=Candidatus Desulfatibia sp. TaxID=3101189 RepID=UPI002F30FA29